MDLLIGRVVLFHEYPGGFGGAERYLQVLAEALVERGVTVAVVVHAADPEAAAPLVERLERAGATVHLHRGRSWPLSIARAVRRYRPQVLHWNGIDPFAFRGGSWLLLPWGRPSVLTDHLPMMRCGLHWETTRRLVNRRVASVLVVGEEGAAAARAHWARPFRPRLRVVRNGVPTGHGSVRPTRSPRERARLLFLGRLEEQKDPGFALEVLRRLTGRGVPVHLTIAGEGSLRSSLEAQVAGHAALRDRVDFAGFISDPEAAFAAADVFLLPSRFEGLPFTPLEALASGLPAVLSDIPPHREIAAVGDGATVAALGDVDAWCDAIESTITSLAERSAAALAHAEAFSATAMVAETLEVYAEAVAGD